MAGVYSSLGSGVLRSSDYGVTWTNEGQNAPEAVVFGTAKNVYAMYGWGIGAGQTVNPTLQVAAQPGSAGWTMPTTPSTMSQGPAESAVTSDGTHDVVLIANYNAGLWRFVEPWNIGTSPHLRLRATSRREIGHPRRVAVRDRQWSDQL